MTALLRLDEGALKVLLLAHDFARSQPVGPGISLPIMGWSELLPGHLLSALAIPPEPSLAALGSVSELIMLCPSAACRVRWSASAHWAMTELSESRRPGLCSRSRLRRLPRLSDCCHKECYGPWLSVRLGYPDQQLECPRVLARAEPGPLTR
jgi:hypothetical protein